MFNVLFTESGESTYMSDVLLETAESDYESGRTDCAITTYFCISSSIQSIAITIAIAPGVELDLKYR
jgi:hypothetical protein